MFLLYMFVGPRVIKETGNNENNELQQEIEELEQKLQEKQDYLFQVQRENLRQQQTAPRARTDSTDNVVNVKVSCYVNDKNM